MKTYIYISICAVALFFVASSADAATSVAGTISSNTTWNKENSPYVLDDLVNVALGSTLTINPGVEVQLNGNGLEIEGNIIAQGTDQDRIIFSDSGSGSLFIAGSGEPARFSYVDFLRVGALGGDHRDISYEHSNIKNTTLSQYHGTLSVEDSTFDTGLFGISAIDATTTITNSSFKHYTKAGIYARRGYLKITDSALEENKVGIQVQDSNPVLSRIQNIFIKTAHADAPFAMIENSTIANNQNYNIQNDAVSMVDARNNWWGSDASPAVTFSGEVMSDPWLHAPPTRTATCCSNVLFLPGLQSSRLYRAGILTEDQLWEPNTDNDVQDLAMATTGESVRGDIYTRDIIEKTNIAPFANPSIYQSFAKEMDQVVVAGAVNAWKPFPYDWRYGPERIVGSSTLVSEIERLASSSQTKKITIVAHSYGGLVAKWLLKKLTEDHRENLIDRIVFVAVPHLGTPKAIGSLVYGDGQSIMGGIALSSITAKQFALNLPSAYILLPSTSYFAQAAKAVIETASSSIDTKTGFNQFLASTNQHLLSKADVVHGLLDSISVPSTITVDTITGTNIPTIDSLAITERRVTTCGVGRSCETETVIDREPHFTDAGDGTVVGSSSIPRSMTQRVHEFDLAALNTIHDANHKHADILEVSDISACVIGIVKGKNCTSTNNTTVQEKVIMSVHSPVDLHLYDTKGRHTGVVYDQKGTRFVEEAIPNTSYIEYGEGKYITAQNKPARIVLDGTGIGTFTFAIEKTSAGTSTHTTFTNIPVTPLTEAQFTVASTSTNLSIDTNSDGVVDIVTSSASSSDPMIIVRTLRGFIGASDMATTTKNRMLDRLLTIEKKIVKNRLKKVDGIEKLIGRIDTGRKPWKKIDTTTKQSIIMMLEQLVDALDKKV